MKMNHGAQTDFYRQFLKRLRQSRLDAHLSTYVTAKTLGWYQAVVVRIESGQRRITAYELAQLAGLYKKDICDLIQPIPVDEEKLTQLRKVG